MKVNFERNNPKHLTSVRFSRSTLTLTLSCTNSCNLGRSCHKDQGGKRLWQNMNMAQMLLYSARCSPEPDGRGQSGCWSHYRWRPNYICGVSNLWRIKQSAGIQFIITLLWCLDSLQQCLVVWKSTECPFGCDASSYKPLYVQYKTFVSCCLPHSGVSPLFSSTTCTLSALKMFCCTEIKPCKECMYLFGTQRCIHCNNTMRALVWGCLLDFYINIFYTLCLIYIIDFFLNVTSTTFPCFFDVFLCCYLNNNQISPWFFFFCLTDFSVFSVLRSSGEVFFTSGCKTQSWELWLFASVIFSLEAFLLSASVP